MQTEKFCASSNAAMEEAATPLPKLEQTPPVTKMYLLRLID